jgi:hypothetical protein
MCKLSPSVLDFMSQQESQCGSLTCSETTVTIFTCPYVFISWKCNMVRKMTVVFHNENLYTCLKTEAARRNMPASEIIADAVSEWLESREDAELLPVIDSARTKWKEKGGRSWVEAEHELEESISHRERTSEVNRA